MPSDTTINRAAIGQDLRDALADLENSIEAIEEDFDPGDQGYDALPPLRVALRFTSIAIKAVNGQVSPDASAIAFTLEQCFGGYAGAPSGENYATLLHALAGGEVDW